jgi:hypothetical protein
MALHIFLSSKPVVMKRLLLSLALALPMLQLLATNPPLIEKVLMNTKVEDRSLVVRLANLQKEKTVLTLESLDGQEVYHEQVIKDHNGFNAKLNLNDLAKGRYLLKIKQHSGVLRQVVVVDPNSILCSKVATE